MRKYYLEVESFRDDSSIIGIRIVDQRTKNRRSKLAKKLVNTQLDFFRTSPGKLGLLTNARDLSEASTKLINLKIRGFTERK